MREWKKVSRCKECGRIYENGIPEICEKCGVQLGTNNAIVSALYGNNRLILTSHCEKVVARKRFLNKWEVKDQAET